jgi:hypothetical protein
MVSKTERIAVKDRRSLIMTASEAGASPIRIPVSLDRVPGARCYPLEFQAISKR